MYQVNDKQSPATSLRERNIEARKQKILAATRILLSRGGLKALSMRKLAEEASLSVNTLYNLWGTREEILRALTLDAKQLMEARLDNIQSPDDPIDYCRFRLATNIQEICRQHELFRPMILAWLEGGIAGQQAPIEPMTQSIQGISQIIQQACEQGILQNALNPDSLAWQIHHGAQFACIQWALGGIDDDQFEARAQYGLNLAFLGIAHHSRRDEIQAKLNQIEKKLQMPAS